MNRSFCSVVVLAAALLPAVASAQTSPSKSTPSKTSTTADRISTSVERDLGLFRDWVNDKLDKADASAKRELPRIKEEYETQSTRIDRGIDSLTAAGKREYQGLKTRYETWEQRQERMNQQARQPENAQQTQTRILGENVNIATARASELPDLFGRFIEYTRDNRKNWLPEDWADASAVLTRLNQRYEKVREQIDIDNRLRIRSWQGEFRTLEKARQTKDALND